MIEQLINSAGFKSHFTTTTNEYTITPFGEKNDYNACTIHIHNQVILYREAKITPKKTGLFVAIWQRDIKNETTPYTINDPFDCLVIAVETETEKGYFLFWKEDLVRLQLISNDSKIGKRGTRVYPQKTSEMNKSALKIFINQIHYYYTI